MWLIPPRRLVATRTYYLLFRIPTSAHILQIHLTFVRIRLPQVPSMAVSLHHVSHLLPVRCHSVLTYEGPVARERERASGGENNQVGFVRDDIILSHGQVRSIRTSSLRYHKRRVAWRRAGWPISQLS